MKGFYVTMKRDTRTAWLLGPFAEHQNALAAVDAARKKANEVDPRSFWDAFGTSSIESEKPLPPGKFNSDLAEWMEAA